MVKIDFNVTQFNLEIMRQLIQKLRYLFDSALESSILNMFIFLIVFSGFLILCFALIVYFLSTFLGWEELRFGKNFGDFIWQSFLHFFSTEAITSDSRPEDYAFNSFDFSLKFLITLIGIGISATIIGIVTQRVDTRFQQLREGYSKIQDKNHILICGFTKKTAPLIQELSVALENKKQVVIVIISNQTVQFTRDMLNSQVNIPKNIKVRIRTGYIWQENILENSRIEECKSIFIMNPDNNEQYRTELDSDIEVAKSFAKIIQSKYWKKNSVKIIMEMFNEEIGNRFIENHFDLIKNADQQPICISTKKMREQLIGQSFVTPDSVDVFESLFGFSGSELYFLDSKLDKENKYINHFFGKKISEINAILNGLIIMGVFYSSEEIDKEKSKNNYILNPDHNFVFNENFGLIFLSENKSKLYSILEETKKIDLKKQLKKHAKIDLNLSTKNRKNNNIALISTSNDISKIEETIRSIIKLNNEPSIENWTLITPENVNFEDRDKTFLIYEYKPRNSIMLGLKLLELRDNKFTKFLIIEKSHLVDKDIGIKVNIGDSIVNIIGNKNTKYGTISSEYKLKEYISSDFFSNNLNFDEILDELNKSQNIKIFIQSSFDGDIHVIEIDLDKLKEVNSALLKNYDILIENQKKSLENINSKSVNFEDFNSHIDAFALQEKFDEFDTIIVLNNEIDENDFSNPIEDHDMIFYFSFFNNFFNKPLNKNNTGEKFWEAPSYITEVNSYKSKLLIESYKKEIAMPFIGIDIIETNSLSSKVLASAFYDQRNYHMIQHFFERINFIKTYTVMNKTKKEYSVRDLKYFFLNNNETFLGYIDYEHSSFDGYGKRVMKNFFINPTGDNKIFLNKGDKIIVLANYDFISNKFGNQEDYLYEVI